MKKFLSVLLVFVLTFLLASCSAVNEENPTEDTAHLDVAPILGLTLTEGETAGFFALTKNGTYAWNAIYPDGTEALHQYDGMFCLDSENLVSFTRAQVGDKAKLTFTGNVMSYSVYCAPAEEIENDKTEIKDDKYKLTPQSSEITIAESGKYYYLVDVIYAQGEVCYGFAVTE